MNDVSVSAMVAIYTAGVIIMSMVASRHQEASFLVRLLYVIFWPFVLVATLLGGNNNE